MWHNHLFSQRNKAIKRAVELTNKNKGIKNYMYRVINMN